jgi:hypothetical protein
MEFSRDPVLISIRVCDQSIHAAGIAWENLSQSPGLWYKAARFAGSQIGNCKSAEY